MATQGLDPTFGLAGTVTTEVSGYGGWPLAVTTGPDGRLTMLCSSWALPATQGPLQAGHRFRNPPIRTLRVVSIPTGPLTGLGRSAVSVFGPPPSDFLPMRAISRPDRFAVLGTIIRANRQVPMLAVFGAGPVVQVVTQWSLAGQVELARLGTVRADQCGLGWGPGDEVIVVAPALRAATRPGLTVTLVSDARPRRPIQITVPLPLGLDLPPTFTIRPRATAVILDSADRLTIGLTWEGLDPAVTGLRPLGTLDQARASVFRLRPTRRVGRPALELDPDFGTDGFWLATGAQGIVTTADFLARREPLPLVVAGQARQPATSLFAAGLDLETGAEQWVRYPADGVVARPTGLEYDAHDRILLVGGTAEYDQNVVTDVSEAVVACLTADGDPDPGYPANGLARFRLHGGTHPVALHAPAGGGAAVASVVPWGWQAAAVSWHPCLTRLTDAGGRDQGFGTAGLASHDGIGDSGIAVVSGSGHVWSAGRVQVFLGPLPPVAPGAPPRTDWLRILTVARLTANGELDPRFGSSGIAVVQLAGMLPPGLQFFDVESLVPLAGGQALCGGWYGGLVPAAFGGGFQFDPQGTWLARLTAGGALDPTFGIGGLRIYPGRRLVPLGQLADGTLQGFESAAVFSIVRLAADGSPAPGFGVNGLSPVTRIPSGWPVRFEPDGGWYAPVAGPFAGTSETVGLLRYRPDGSVDPLFGAGDPANLTGRVINVASTGLYGAMLATARPHVIRLADGSFLVVWSLTWQADVTVFGSFNTVAYRAESLLLLAFNADGTPRPRAGWNNQAARGHLNPLAQAIPLGNWLGWRPTCVQPQSDGSIIVGLVGDDLAAKPPANVGPGPIRQTCYFCRLVPPDFSLDGSFGTGAGGARGFAVGRLHQEAEQVPVGLGAGTGGQVVAAIAVIVSDPIGGSVRSPDLPLDGSLAVARLV